MSLVFSVAIYLKLKTTVQPLFNYRSTIVSAVSEQREDDGGKEGGEKAVEGKAEG